MTEPHQDESPEVEVPSEEGTSAPAGADPLADLDDVSDVSGTDRVEGEVVEPSDVVDTSAGDELALAQIALEERTLDLQRLQAEYVNYKRRVDRDRDLVKQNATYAALAPITEVLDTIDRARESAQSLGQELEGGLKTVADQLERTVAAAGLVKFGAVGDAFDPTVHEALSTLGADPEVTVTTVKVLAKSGYKVGDRVVRAAQVLTVEPG